MSIPVDLLVRSWFLTGPTAAGKTAVSLRLADALHAEIISLDSMAIYRGMDIGTAKPDAVARQRVPHHLIDIADPWEEFSVAEFLSRASAAAGEIVGRGRTPLFVGGTGLYLRSALRGIHAGPPADWALRGELRDLAKRSGPAALHAQLEQLDPAAAARLHPNDLRRVIRAIEVARRTGTGMSQTQGHGPRPESERPRCVVWLEPPRAWLRERIERRVHAMMEAGLLDEVRRLRDQRPPLSRTARQALGYRELLEHLDGGCTREQAVRQIITATRQFAKRQHTWFRNLEECASIAVSGRESPEAICDAILAARTAASPSSPRHG